MTKETAAALAGAALGLVGSWILTAVTDWWRQWRELKTALRIISGELSENINRLNREDIKPTLGDWEGAKVTIARLLERNEDLWRQITATYRLIYENIATRKTPNDLTEEKLKTLAKALYEERRRQIPWRVPRGPNRDHVARHPDAGGSKAA